MLLMSAPYEFREPGWRRRASTLVIGLRTSTTKTGDDVGVEVTQVRERISVVEKLAKFGDQHNDPDSTH
jgi:hypothetical protein